MADELIIYVNDDGTPTGETATKLRAHNARTKLHLGFSCYVFNETGDILVTQRAFGKKVWPGVWTNSVCGHPAPQEAVETAITRRLHYELGMTATDLRLVLPNYTYTTPPFNGIIENEFCPVYVARTTSSVAPNPDEVEDYAWMTWQAFMELAQADAADSWSWWCKDQIKQLAGHPLIAEYSKIS